MPGVARLIELALEEDLGRGDVTTAAVVGDTGRVVSGVIVAREAMVVYGISVALEVFSRVSADIRAEPRVADGERVVGGTEVIGVRGPSAAILEAERTVLNFMQRLSGVATLSRRYADAVSGTGARVVDTRKTTPGYRALQKAAVLAGGSGNHRFDLGSGVLIKDNHIVACGSVTEAVTRAKQSAPHPLRIECEVETDAQLTEALDAGADVVLLDNMTPDQVAAAVKRAHERNVLVEVSGGITLDTIRAYADAGADFISVGALTHSAQAMDLALDFAA